MKKQILSVLLILAGFTSQTFAGQACRVTVLQRVDSTAARRPLERFEERLRKMDNNTSLFSYSTHETQVSEVVAEADSARACYDLALAKAAEMQDDQSNVEIEPLRDLLVEERFLTVPTHPIVRWRFSDAWSLPSMGAVSKFTNSCNGVTDESFRGSRLYKEDCHRM